MAEYEEKKNPISADDLFIIQRALDWYASSAQDEKAAEEARELAARWHHKKIVPTGDLAIRVGDMSIDFKPRMEPHAGYFYLGCDSIVLIDGKPLDIAAQLCTVDIHIEKDCPVQLVLGGNMRPSRKRSE